MENSHSVSQGWYEGMYGGNFIFPLFSFPNFLWWSYVTFLKMPVHKMKHWLVWLKALVLEVAMGRPINFFFGGFDPVFHATIRTSLYCGQRPQRPQYWHKAKKFFLHTLTPRMSKAQTNCLPCSTVLGHQYLICLLICTPPWTICWPGGVMRSLPPHPLL